MICPTLSLAFGVLLSVSQTTGPTTQPSVEEILEQARQEAMAERREALESLPEADLIPVAELLEYRLENDFLLLSLGERSERGRWRQPLEELPESVNRLQVREPRETEDTVPTFDLTIHRTGDEPNEVIHYTAVTVGPLLGQLILSRDTAILTEDGGEAVRNVNLVQLPLAGAPEDPGIRLMVSGDVYEEASELPVNLSADSFVALMREEPVAFHRYVSPLLDEVGLSEVVDQQVRQAAQQLLLRSAGVDADTEAQVSKLIDQLDSDDFATREEAEKSLKDLGQAATTAIGRILEDEGAREHLSAEQALRLRNILAEAEPFPARALSALAEEPAFWRRVEKLSGEEGDEVLVEKASTRPAEED